MGTLTAGVPRLDEHCPHKLPSSCRLTARPVCCACQDTRPHCASYSVYVDGVGFVQRGTRWQGYCWFCREFWNNRVAASGLSPPQTRIPEEPDQTEFLDRWYDFHRGYRILTTDDGTEILMDVSGEPLHGVAPGCLPRTLEELRTGRPAALGLSSAPRQTQASAGAPEGPSESIEDTIGALLDEANAEDAVDVPVEAPVETPVETPLEHESVHLGNTNLSTEELSAQMDRLKEEKAELLTELRRLQSDLETHRSFRDMQRQYVPVEHEHIIDATDIMGREGLTMRLRSLQQEAAHISTEVRRIGAEVTRRRAIQVGRQRREVVMQMLQERRDVMNRHLPAMSTADPSGSPSSTAGPSQPPRHTTVQDRRERYMSAMRGFVEATQAKSRAEAAIRDHRSTMSSMDREWRTAEDYARVFGTREEMESQGEDYYSPISGMFNRAWDRYRRAEEQRRNPDGPDPDVSVAALNQTSEVFENEVPDPSLVARAIALFFGHHRRVLNLDARGSSRAHQEARRTAWLEFTNNDEFLAIQIYDRILQERLDIGVPVALTPRESIQRLRNEDRPAFDFVRRIYPNLTINRAEFGLTDVPFSMGAWIRILSRIDEVDPEPPLPARGLDNDASRPEAKTEEEMTTVLECKVCFSQCADTALLPCGHMVMCRWCADIQIPARPNDHTQPAAPAKCPTCRKKVTKRVRIYT